MNRVPEGEGRLQQSVIGRTEIVLLLVPFWLVLFYFKADISSWLTARIFSLPKDSLIPGTFTFFLTTFLKVFLLLVLIIFIMGLIRTWIPMTLVRNRLIQLPPLSANCLAGLLGVISPFCSCSAIPLFISFLESGVPLGITFSFLIASPLVNEIIVIMLFSLFGWKIAVLYMVAGLIIAITSGFIIDNLKLERFLPLWLLNFRKSKGKDFQGRNLEERVTAALQSTSEVLSRTWVFILAGILLGAVIHGYFPDTILKELTGSNKWLSLPLVVLTGIPLYSCSAAVAPVALAMVDKGMPMGTALAFIMAVAGLSLPEFIMLRKVLSLKLIWIFALTVFAGILLMGYFFNLVL